MGRHGWFSFVFFPGSEAVAEMGMHVVEEMQGYLRRGNASTVAMAKSGGDVFFNNFYHACYEVE